MKIHLVGAELFLVDRQTDVTKLIIAFRNFVKAPYKNGCFSGCKGPTIPCCPNAKICYCMNIFTQTSR